MTHKEYEQKYADALDKIRRTIVGNPERLHDGTRLVIIDGKSCTDEAVFIKAWGRETAQEIMKQKPG
jgi:hypothetical protein